MKLISHRGNINGPISSLENNPIYITQAIEKGYDVQIDIWANDRKLFLGNDNPQYRITVDWIEQYYLHLWLHCKNIEAVEIFNFLDPKGNYLNYFWHENDVMAMTSKGYLWVHPGKQPIKDSVAVMPEISNDDISMCFAVCSNFPEHFKA